jgi:multidrug efflux pump subunit AcrB
MIVISTVYPGTSPVEMDSLISDKIYKEIKDIDGIDTISSNSSLGVSSVSVSLKTDADTKDVMSDIRNSVNKVSLPSDAKTPTVTEIETDTNQTFSVFLYSKVRGVSKSLLLDRAIMIQKEVEKTSGIESVDISS